MEKSLEMYHKLDPFKFIFVDPLPIQKVKGANKAGCKWIYYGQCKPGTKMKHGVGIWVYSNGATLYLFKFRIQLNHVSMKEVSRMTKRMELVDISLE